VGIEGSPLSVVVVLEVVVAIVEVDVAAATVVAVKLLK